MVAVALSMGGLLKIACELNYLFLSIAALKAIEGIGEEGANRVRIGISKDGSGVGAALIALVAANLESSTDTGAPANGGQ